MVSSVVVLDASDEKYKGGVVVDEELGTITRLYVKDGVVENEVLVETGHKFLDFDIAVGGETMVGVTKSDFYIYDKDGVVDGSHKAGGDFIRITPDSRIVYVGTDKSLQSINIHDREGYWSNGKPSQANRFQIEEKYDVPPDIVAMEMSPDGEYLYLVHEPDRNKIPFISNDILDVARKLGTVEHKGADLQKEITITRLKIANGTDTLRQPAKAMPEPFSLGDIAAHRITDMAISPDGNIALITAKGIQKARSTPFGVIPTSDELTGGVIVVDLNSMTKLDYISTSLDGQSTRSIRNAIALRGLNIKHPVVAFTEEKLNKSRERFALGSDQYDSSIGASNLLLEYLNDDYTHRILEKSFADFGEMQAYSDMYPTDMVGANGVGISNRGDFAIISMQSTNNLGFMPIGLADGLTGYGAGNHPSFAFNTVTERIINGQDLDYSFNQGIIEGNADDTVESEAARAKYYWLAPSEVAFGADDSLAVIAMLGGLSVDPRRNLFGGVNLAKDRGKIFTGTLSGGTATLSAGVMGAKTNNAHEKPLQASAYHPTDTDGDGLSDYVEAFNRWNYRKNIYFGDTSQLASTNRFNISSPVQVPLINVFPSNQASQGYLLPHSGVGYRFNYNGHPEYSINTGAVTTIATIERLGLEWYRKFLNGSVSRPYFVVMDMSHPGGGLVVNEQGEPLHYSLNDGYQATFAYMTKGSDKSYDFVVSNIPKEPLNNQYQRTSGFDIADTTALINLLLAETDTVEKIIIDPLAASEMGLSSGPIIEIHGHPSRDVPSRRDHDNFFRVKFKDASPESVTINVDSTSRVFDENNQPTVLAVSDTETGNQGPFAYSIDIHDSEAVAVKIDGPLFYDHGMNDRPVGSDFISVDQLDGVLWGGSNTLPITVEYYKLKDNVSDPNDPYDLIGSYTYSPGSVRLTVSISNTPAVTTGDSDGDKIPDFADGYNLDSYAGTGDANGNWIDDALDDSAILDIGGISATISASDITIEGDALVKIDYDASPPGAVANYTRVVKKDESTFALEYETYFELPEIGAIRLWKDPVTANYQLSDYVGPGQYLLSDFGGNTISLDLQLVGNATDSKIEFSVDPDGLDGPIGFIGKGVAYVWGASPGKDLGSVLVSSAATNSNGIPDYVDFSGTASHSFKQISVPKPSTSGNFKTPPTIGLDYSASDPGEIKDFGGNPLLTPQAIKNAAGSVLIPAGSLRIWNTDASASRNPASIKDGGNYVPPGIYESSLLPDTLYVEAVKASSGPSDQRITFEIFSGVVKEDPGSRKPVTEGNLGNSADLAYSVVTEVKPGAYSQSYIDLTAYDQLWDASFAPDADYRKFDINGQPIQDPKPQNRAEADISKSGFYVDSYTLAPVLSKTDFSVPLLGEVLTMDFRRTASIDAYLSKTASDTTPVNAVGEDNILGNGWRTNIGMRAVFRDGQYTVYDPNGQAHHYSKSGQPIAHSFTESSTNRSDLQISTYVPGEDDNVTEATSDRIESIVWTENFWTEYYFERYKPKQDDFGKRPIVGQLLRLKYIRDYNSNGIEFTYSNETNSYPVSMHEVAFMTTNKRGKIGRSWVVQESFDEKKVKFFYESRDRGLRLAVMLKPNGKGNSYWYDSSDRLERIDFPAVQGSGVTTEKYTYDDRGLDSITSDAYVHNVAIASIENRNGKKTMFTYDVADRIDAYYTEQAQKMVLKEILNPDGGQSTFSLGQHTVEKTQTTISGANDTVYTMNFSTGVNYSSQTVGTGLAINGFSIPYLRKMTRTQQNDSWTATFSEDTRCNLLELVDLNGTTHTFAYGGDGADSRFDYARYGRPSASALTGGDVALSWEFKYNYQNRRLTEVILPEQTSKTNVTFDQVNDRQVASIKREGSGGQGLRFEYDATYGYVTKRFDPDGRKVEITKSAKASGWDRIEKRYKGYGDSSDLYQTRTLTYDLNGNLESEKIEYLDGVVTTTHMYDASDNRTETTYPSQFKESWTYYGMGQVKTIKDGNGYTTSFFYDDRENLAGVTTPVASQAYQYNKVNLLKEHTDGNGRKREFDYDHYNRLLSDTKANAIADSVSGKISAGHSVAYDYTGLSGSNFFANDRWNPTKVTDAIGMIETRSYDNAYRLTGKAQAGETPKSETYTLDNNGNVTSIAVTGGATINMVYDPLNRMTKRSFSAASDIIKWTYEYDEVGNLIRTVDPENYVIQVELDGMNQVLRQVQTVSHTSNPSFILRDGNSFALDENTIHDDDVYLKYEYDGRGNRLKQILRRYTGWDKASLSNIVTAYTYDKESRMKTMVEDAGGLARTTTYNYDNNSNVDYVVTAGANDANVTLDFDYDAGNRMTSSTAPLQNAVVYTYDDNDNVITVAGPKAGSVVTNKYDALDRLTSTVAIATNADPIKTYSVYDGNGNTTESAFFYASTGFARTVNAYDKFNRLVSTTDPIGNETTFGYDVLDNMTRMTDPKGNVYTYDYDVASRLNFIQNPSVTSGLAGALTGGSKTMFDRDRRGLVTRVTDGNDNKSFYTLDGLGRVIGLINAYLDINRFTYDQVGNLLGRTDFKETPSSFLYDNLSRMTHVRDRAMNVASYQYDLVDNMIGATDFEGNASAFTYDALNRMVSEKKRGNSAQTIIAYNQTGGITSITDENGNATTMALDGFDRALSITDAENFTTSYTYDTAGNTLTQSDALTRTTAYAFDRLNRLQSVTEPLGKSTSYLYDKNSNLTRITDANTNITTFDYDQLNRITNHNLPGGLTYQYGYDFTTNPLVTVNPRGDTITRVFDKLNRLTNESFPGYSYAYTYDKNSNQLTADLTSPHGIWKTLRGYNARDLMTTEESDYPGMDSRSIVYKFNKNRALDEVTTPNNRVLDYVPTAYDYTGTISGSFGSAGALDVTYQYDEARRMTGCVTASGGITKNYGYDKRNLLLSIISSHSNNSPPSGAGIVSNAYAYDSVGNRERQSISYDLTTDSVHDYANVFNYDELYRVTGAKYDVEGVSSPTYASVVNPDNWQSYTYDLLHNRVAIANNDIDIEYNSPGGGYSPDPLNRVNAINIKDEILQAERVAEGETIVRTFTRASLLFGPSTITLNFGVESVDLAPGLTVLEMQQALEAVPGIGAGNVAVTDVDGSFEFELLGDLANGPTPLTVAPSANYEIVEETVTTYVNESQQIEHRADLFAGNDIILDFGGEVFTYPYDTTSVADIQAGIDLLSAFEPGDVTFTQSGDYLQFDFSGNLEGQIQPLITLTVDLSDQINLTHDANGNLTTDEEGRIYAWNAINQLESVSDGSGLIVSYAYDADGRRVAKIYPDGTRKYYYYDGYEVVVEMDEAQNVTAEYLLGNSIDRPVAMVVGGAAYYFHQDALGNVQAVTNAAGGVVERYSYDIYGNHLVLDADGVPRIDQSTAFSPYLFTGRRLDPESGLFYYRNRCYSPTLGRFLSHDPLDYIDGMNMYAYVNGNPVNFTDPMGLMSFDDALGYADTFVREMVSPATDYYWGEGVYEAAIDGAVGVYDTGTASMEGVFSVGFAIKDDPAGTFASMQDAVASAYASYYFDPGGTMVSAEVSIRAHIKSEWKTSRGQGRLIAIIPILAMEEIATLGLSKVGKLKYVQKLGEMASGLARKGGRGLRAAGESIVDHLQNTPSPMFDRFLEQGIPLGIGKNAPRMKFARFAVDPSQMGPRVATNRGGGSSAKYRVLREKYDAYKARKGADAMSMTEWAKHTRSQPWGIGNAKSGFKNAFDPIQEHHIFVQKHKQWFSDRGVEVDDFTVPLRRSAHLKGVHGKGGVFDGKRYPGRFNARWQQFINAEDLSNPYTSKQIYQFGGSLMDEYNLSGLPITPYSH